MRQLNSSAIVRFALHTGEFTATEAMSATSLTRATVLDVCSDLIGVGWLEECADTRIAGLSSKGRPARRYRLRQGSSVVVGLDAGEHHFTVRIADLRGTTLLTREKSIDSRALGAKRRVEIARSFIAQSLEELGHDAGSALLTVVGVPAPVDAEGSSPVGEGSFWPLMNPGFREALTGMVVVENDANLAALAERVSDDAGCTGNTATLLTGERFGAGLIVDGRLLRGARGGAGELRLLDVIFPGDAHATDGIGALARKWARYELDSAGASSTLRQLRRDEIEAEDVFRAARDGDAFANDIIARLGSRLARVTFALASLIDVERVVVAGAIAPALDPVLEHARATLAEEFYPPLPEIVTSELGREVVVRGAIECAIDHIWQQPLDFVPRPSVSVAAIP